LLYNNKNKSSNAVTYNRVYSLAEEAGITWLTGRGTRERENISSSIFYSSSFRLTYTYISCSASVYYRLYYGMAGRRVGFGRWEMEKEEKGGVNRGGS
jgi:hypothetical protein